MALQGLLYCPPAPHNGDLVPEARRGGIPVFDGSAEGFDEWKFRVLSKHESYSNYAEDDRDRKRMELADKIVESLRGVAFQAIMDVGLNHVMTPLGAPRIIECLEVLVRPMRKEEATQLWNEGHKKDGKLSRQRGETM